jgi:lysophospholipase L1-like esterase
MTIAVLGDSMVDTLGPGVPHLVTELKKTYPDTTFTVLNHGVGAENIDSGLRRITSSYTYLGESRPSVVSQNPDVVVVESFGYNPYTFDAGALETHWLALSAIVDTLRVQGEAKVVIAATIAPNWDVFGDGAAGLSFSPTDKHQRVDVIRKYLDSTVKFAQSQGLPLADAFHPSLTNDGNGNLVYINAGDHIHYSDAGRALFARVVAQAIVANRLLE